MSELPYCQVRALRELQQLKLTTDREKELRMQHEKQVGHLQPHNTARSPGNAFVVLSRELDGGAAGA